MAPAQPPKIHQTICCTSSGEENGGGVGGEISLSSGNGGIGSSGRRILTDAKRHRIHKVFAETDRKGWGTVPQEK
jgi:hypothetical protein